MITFDTPQLLKIKFLYSQPLHRQLYWLSIIIIQWTIADYLHGQDRRLRFISLHYSHCHSEHWSLDRDHLLPDRFTFRRRKLVDKIRFNVRTLSRLHNHRSQRTRVYPFRIPTRTAWTWVWTTLDARSSIHSIVWIYHQ